MFCQEAVLIHALAADVDTSKTGGQRLANHLKIESSDSRPRVLYLN